MYKGYKMALGRGGGVDGRGDGAGLGRGEGWDEETRLQISGR